MDGPFRARFAEFVRRAGAPVMSSVVIAEILFGAAKPSSPAGVLAAAARIEPALAPTAADWQVAALAVSRLEKPGAKSRSFWNDALLASQCARLNLTLITSNLADFRRLQREIPVRLAAPFPA